MPDGRTFICISQKWRLSLHDVRTYRAADIGSDDFLVRAEIRLKLRKQKQPSANSFTLDLQNVFELLEKAEDMAAKGLWKVIKNLTRMCMEDATSRHQAQHKKKD